MKKILYIVIAIALLLPSSLSAQTLSKNGIPVTVIAEAGFGLNDCAGVQGIIGHQVGDRFFAGVGMVHYERSLFSSARSYSLLNAAFVDARYALTGWKVAPYVGADLGFGFKGGGLYAGLEAGARMKMPGLFGKSHLWLSLCWDRVTIPAYTDEHIKVCALKLGYSF